MQPPICLSITVYIQQFFPRPFERSKNLIIRVTCPVCRCMRHKRTKRIKKVNSYTCYCGNTVYFHFNEHEILSLVEDGTFLYLTDKETTIIVNFTIDL